MGDVTPVVTPWAPARGWREASGTRRASAVGVPVLLLLWSAVLGLEQRGLDPNPLVTALGWAWLALAPPAFYSAARVLRPHGPRPSRERTTRHWAGSTGAAFGSVTLVTMVLQSAGWADPEADVAFGIATTYGVAGAALALVSVPWGLVALVVRAAAAGDRAERGTAVPTA